MTIGPYEKPFCQGPVWKPRRSADELGTCGACGEPLEVLIADDEDSLPVFSVAEPPYGPGGKET